MKIYDLDGTLSTLNSTFDFVISYHKSNEHFWRLFICNTIRRIMNRLSISAVTKRKILIFVYFFAIKTSTLEHFFDEEYQTFFSKSLTDLGSQVKAENNSEHALLTGCTSIPARQIAEWFGFREAVFTELKIIKGRAFGISLDTYGNNKITPIRNLLNKKDILFKDVTYYTDDVKSENELIKLFGTVLIYDY